MNTKTIVGLCEEAQSIVREPTDNARLARLVADLCEWIKQKDSKSERKDADELGLAVQDRPMA